MDDGTRHRECVDSGVRSQPPDRSPVARRATTSSIYGSSSRWSSSPRSSQLVGVVYRARDPRIQPMLRFYLPLIITNCTILAIGVAAPDRHLDLLGTLMHALAAAVGFTVAIAMFAALHARIDAMAAPPSFRGAPAHADQHRPDAARVHGADGSSMSFVAAIAVLGALTLLLGGVLEAGGHDVSGQPENGSSSRSTRCCRKHNVNAADIRVVGPMLPPSSRESQSIVARRAAPPRSRRSRNCSTATSLHWIRVCNR